MEKNGNENTMAQRLVFIFKASKEKHVMDRYEEILGQHGFPFAAIPVLSFEFVNRESLASLLSQPENLSAIILTSPRTVQAVDNAMRDFNISRDTIVAIQCFVVGQTTHESAVAAGFKPEGRDSGNGDALADYVLKNIKDSSKSLLFPCSNLRRENIPKILKKQGLSITELVVYETNPDRHIEENMKNALCKKGIPEYTVFFSPSGFNYFQSAANGLPFSIEQTKIIALGPTTASAITDRGYAVNGIAEKPDPESLLHLLQKGM